MKAEPTTPPHRQPPAELGSPWASRAPLPELIMYLSPHTPASGEVGSTLPLLQEQDRLSICYSCQGPLTSHSDSGSLLLSHQESKATRKQLKIYVVYGGWYFFVVLKK